MDINVHINDKGEFTTTTFTFKRNGLYTSYRACGKGLTRSAIARTVNGLIKSIEIKEDMKFKKFITSIADENKAEFSFSDENDEEDEFDEDYYEN